MIRRLFVFFLVVFLSAPAQAEDDIRLAAAYQTVHAEGVLRSADLTLVGIANLFSYRETSAINDLIIHNSLNRHVERVAGLNALFTTDVEGRLRHDSFRYPTRNLNLKDRPYIQQALQLDNNGLYIGVPIENPIVSYDSLPLSRPIFNQQGHITGVGVAIMTPDHLIRRNKVCKKCIVSIYRLSGEKVVSFPAALEAQPNILAFTKEHPADTIVKIDINGLATQTLWSKFESYDLILLYSYFE